MIVGIGMDIVDVTRIAAMLEKHGDTFPARHFTAAEIGYCDAGRGPARAQRYAARFAAKEAAAKALACGIGPDAGWQEIEVVRSANADTGYTAGPPTVALHGTAAATAKRLKVRSIWLTIAHEKAHAVATVILER